MNGFGSFVAAARDSARGNRTVCSNPRLHKRDAQASARLKFLSKLSMVYTSIQSRLV